MTKIDQRALDLDDLQGWEDSPPSRVRFRVLGLACILAVITYIHRVGFATASAEMKGPLGLTDRHLGWLMAAFMIAYGVFEVPWGLLGDRFGARNVLAVIILGGSALTAALPLVGLLPAGSAMALIILLLLRFVFGAFQAGTFPSISRTIADWIPVNERGGSQGLLWMSSRIGGALAPALVAWLMLQFGNWRVPLIMAALLGLAWCAAFWPWFRNRPEEMPEVNSAELATIRKGRTVTATHGHGPIPWSQMLASHSVLALCAMYGFLGYSGNFFLTLLPTYLRTHRQIDAQTAGYLTSLPFACGVASCLVGGALSDVLIRVWSPRWGRRVVGACGLAVAGVGILAASQAQSVTLLGFLLCLTFVGNDLAMGPAWAAATDIGGKHTGVLSGAMNMMASLTAACAAILTGHLFEEKSFVLPFVLFAASYGLGALCWLRVDVTETLAD